MRGADLPISSYNQIAKPDLQSEKAIFLWQSADLERADDMLGRFWSCRRIGHCRTEGDVQLTSPGGYGCLLMCRSQALELFGKDCLG